MARYTRTLVSDRDAPSTFAYLADFTHAAEWDPGTVRAELVGSGSDVDPLVDVGTRFALEVRVGAGRTTAMEYVVEEYVAPHRIVLVGESASVRSVDTITVAPRAEGGSVVTYDAELTLKGTLAFLSPVLSIPFRRVGDAGVAGLLSVLAPDRSNEAPSAPSLLSGLIDETLEASVVGSFSAIGPRVRRKSARWQPPGDLHGRVALVTGATSGIGLATAKGLVRQGAEVVFLARDAVRAECARAEIATVRPDAPVSFLIADVSDLESVRRAAAEFAEGHDRLDVLVHNAGALLADYTTNAEGTEITVAAQLLGPYLLTGLLWPQLVAAAPARVIQVSSGGMYTQRFDLATMEMTPQNYDGTTAYARVKRAQLVLMHEWVRRADGVGVQFHAMHPGWADTPGIRDALPGFADLIGPVLRTADEGADTICWLAAAPEGAAMTGAFWLDRRPRWESKLPWTYQPQWALTRSGADLWKWCASRTGWDGLATPRSRTARDVP